jgi:hypothetical protein
MKKIGRVKVWFVLSLAVLGASAGVAIFWPAGVEAYETDGVTVARSNGESSLSVSGLGTFHRTVREVTEARAIEMPESPAKVVVWNETAGGGSKVPHYAISLDGKTVSAVKETSYELMLRYGKFDPLVGVPSTPSELTARRAASGKGAYIVQFVTQPLDEYRAVVRSLGGDIFIHLPNHSYIVQMDSSARDAVAALPFVRWVGDYQPAYKLDEGVRDSLADNALEPTRYNVMVLERGSRMQERLGQKVRSRGGKVELIIPEGFRMEMTLTADQVVEVANDPDVLFIDRWSAPESDMDIVRNVGGANFIENTLGYKGQGVRAEVMDNGLRQTHTDFNTITSAPLIHNSPDTLESSPHGSSTYGINFGRGTTNAAGRGMLPEATGIFADYDHLTNRYAHTARLLQDPYKAVYQSNSWGSALTAAYTTISAEMDDILFINDFTLLNSQSNNGNQLSRPQAWAKNVVSIGGIRHFNTASLTDDRWQSGASIGPAADGRLKPELAHYYDSVFTTSNTSDTSYTSSFGGTSAATPITAGHFGIFFQMWHNGLFGNPTGATVFDSRPHMTTAKAVMINTAVQWDMTIPGTDTTRVRQGFGRVDLTNLYNLRNSMFIVDETDVLTNLQSRSYTKTVPAGSTNPLKVTMTYADPMGSPSATRARINDLTLKVTAPDGTIYWGNNGLGVGGGMWSTPGGSANIVDTVENVFIQAPAAGNWTIEVIASELVQDARVQTPGVVDADYSLVVSGIVNTPPPTSRPQFDFDGDAKTDLSIFRPAQAEWWYLRSSDGGNRAFQFGTASDRIAPADFTGDGKTDLAYFRNSTGQWFVLRSEDSSFFAFPFGANNDVPVPADFDADGKADPAVYRPSNQTWYVAKSTGGTDIVGFGSAGDVPVAADYDGDNKADIAIYRPNASGGGQWWMLRSSNQSVFATVFGASTDRIVPGDYTGDGKADMAFWRPANGSWYILRSEDLSFFSFPFGANGDTPVPGDYDGDGRNDAAVYRPSTATWYANRTTGGTLIQQFGILNDIPLPSAYVR